MAATNNIFALFKNGVEIPNTRFEATDMASALSEANPNPLAQSLIFHQLSGHATIQLNADDEIQLRCIQFSGNDFDPELRSSDGVSLAASLNIAKVS